MRLATIIDGTPQMLLATFTPLALGTGRRKARPERIVSFISPDGIVARRR